MRNVDLELGEDKQPSVTRKYHVWSCETREKFSKQSSLLIPNMYSVAASRVHVASFIHLDSIRYSSICVSKDAAVRERVRSRVNVEIVTGTLVKTRLPTSHTNVTYMVAGAV
jgi:hypothetical protein